MRCAEQRHLVHPWGKGGTPTSLPQIKPTAHPPACLLPPQCAADADALQDEAHSQVAGDVAVLGGHQPLLAAHPNLRDGGNRPVFGCAQGQAQAGAAGCRPLLYPPTEDSLPRLVPSRPLLTSSTGSGLVRSKQQESHCLSSGVLMAKSPTEFVVAWPMDSLPAAAGRRQRGGGWAVL